ncbi:hypothetical protein SANTM175S_06101 [Streptomyces antimycoticus]
MRTPTAPCTAFREATHQIDPADQVAGRCAVHARQHRPSPRQDQRGSVNTAYDNSQYYSLTVENYNELINSLLLLSQDMAEAASNPAMIQQHARPRDLFLRQGVRLHPARAHQRRRCPTNPHDRRNLSANDQPLRRGTAVDLENASARPLQADLRAERRQRQRSPQTAPQRATPTSRRRPCTPTARCSVTPSDLDRPKKRTDTRTGTTRTVNEDRSDGHDRDDTAQRHAAEGPRAAQYGPAATR